MTRQNYIFLLSRTKKRLYFFPEYKKSTIFAHAFADMAQLVEQRIRNAWVRGSSPLIGSKHRKAEKGCRSRHPFFSYIGAHHDKKRARHHCRTLINFAYIITTYNIILQ